MSTTFRVKTIEIAQNFPTSFVQLKVWTTTRTYIYTSPHDSPKFIAPDYDEGQSVVFPKKSVGLVICATQILYITVMYEFPVTSRYNITLLYDLKCYAFLSVFGQCIAAKVPRHYNPE